ncbi:MAG: hypothetical protein WDM77_00535 [Steroidobacteraceae bacterium]
MLPPAVTSAAICRAQVLPDYVRPAANVSLVAERGADDLPLGAGNFGNIDIQAGASILADPGASLSLTSEGGILVAGTLQAAGGHIALKIVSPSDIFPTNPDAASQVDPGYLANQGIELASSAVLDAKGATLLTPSSAGLLIGTVLPGGSVSLIADRGTVTAESGSSIDISGTSAPLDLVNPSGAAYTRTTVASAGGSLTVASNDSVSLLGRLSAAAGTGGSGQAAAGSLAIGLVGSNYDPNKLQPSAAPYQIDLIDSAAGASPTVPNSNTAILGVAQLQQSGIDSLSLQVSGGVAPDRSCSMRTRPLIMGRMISLDAPDVQVEGLNARLSAPVVQIGNSQVSGPGGHSHGALGGHRYIVGDCRPAHAAGCGGTAGDLQRDPDQPG